eukprot:TRINITY_DN25742_c0_g9_i1.p1 TRINITY_DN25742_c0_g9~~TRINITY_DN25742_c0_g9_i1.p1  ORF type:complete len:531 (-),score=106.35 TRINITY_DN25742_c0_g9_i1:50-1642(-)
MSAKEKGNVAFKAGDFHSAKEFYTAALLENPQDAVVWGNRSAAHLSLGCPHWAAADAIRAVTIDSTYAKGFFRVGSALTAMSGYKQAVKNFESCLALGPDPLVTKKLHHAQEMQKQGESDLHLASGGKCSSFYTPPATSMDTPSADNLRELNDLYGQHACTKLVDIQPSPERGGLGLFCLQDCAEEDTVLLDESPLVAISLGVDQCVVCAASLTDAGVTCEHCMHERYCSEKCRSAAWDQYHRSQCGQVAQSISSFRAEMYNMSKLDEAGTQNHCYVLAAARIVGMLTQGEFLGGLNSHREFCNIHSLTDCAEEDVREQIAHPFKTRYSQWKMLAKTLELDALGHVKFDFGFYDTLWHMLKGNMIRFPDVFVLGRCGSFANHSCDANAVAKFQDGRLQLRSLRPLRKGEELLVAYINTNAPRTQRRKELLDGYWFTCRCDRCESAPGEPSAAGASGSGAGSAEEKDWLLEATRMMPMLQAMLSGQPGEEQLRSIVRKYGYDGTSFVGIGATSQEEFESDFRAAFVAAGFG